MREKKYNHFSNSSLYINYEGFAIRIYLFELYHEDEPGGNEEETYHRGLTFLKEKGIPVDAFPRKEETYYIN